jgi:ABC-type Fe3+-hydroxamate transport system substrate-binding protein
MRIAATEPSITATLAAIGAYDALVAVSTHCARLTPAVSDLPTVSTTWAVTPGELTPHRPDLVITAPPYREGRIEALVRAGLRVLCLTPSDLTSIMGEARLLGRLVRREAAAERAIEELEAALTPPALEGERVYIEIWPNPLTTAPVWVYEIVERLGGKPVPPSPNARVTAEEVITADPEVALVAWVGVAELSTDALLGREAWQTTTAVRNRRAAVVDEIAINAPGLNLVRGVGALRRALAAASAR